MQNRFVVRMLTKRKGLPKGCAWTTYLDVPASATFGRGHAGRMTEDSPYFMFWDAQNESWERRPIATIYVAHSGETLAEETDFEIIRLDTSRP